MKQAYLVCISPMTRAVVNTKGKTQDEIETEAIELAIEKMRQNPKEYLCFDNCDEVREDSECPATIEEPTTWEE